jgi:hypothetical protein
MSEDKKMKIGDKKVGKVSITTQASEIERTGAVDEVTAIKSATAVGAVGKSGGVGKRSGTRSMTLAERQQLFSMINEEADKIFAEGTPLAKQKDMLKQAVKMAVDAGIVDDDDSK